MIGQISKFELKVSISLDVRFSDDNSTGGLNPIDDHTYAVKRRCEPQSDLNSHIE